MLLKINKLNISVSWSMIKVLFDINIVEQLIEYAQVRKWNEMSIIRSNVLL